MRRSLARLLVGLALGCVTLPACSGDYELGCPGNAVTSYRVQVLGPDGSRICDAVVTEDADGWHQQLWTNGLPDAYPGDAGCDYYSETARPGTYQVTASKPGYVDAHGTTHIHSTGGDCAYGVGESLTLHLMPAGDAGTPADAATE